MWLAILVSKEIKHNRTYTVTREMADAAPEFETNEEANKYADMISEDYLWVIIPKPGDETLKT